MTNRNRKSVLVTGAGSGIGRAVALRFAGTGAVLTLAGRRRPPLEQTADLVRERGGDALVHPVDITDADAVCALADAVVGRFAGVDVLVNCAAIASVANTPDMAVDTATAMIATNCTGALHLARAVWPHLQARGGGIIINLSSMASYDPFEGLGVYGATKSFVNLLTQAMAAEGKSDNIAVFAVAPGAVDTPMLRGLFPDFPRDRCLSPGEVADLIATLTQPECRYSTGQTVRIQK